MKKQFQSIRKPSRGCSFRQGTARNVTFTAGLFGRRRPLTAGISCFALASVRFTRKQRDALDKVLLVLGASLDRGALLLLLLLLAAAAGSEVGTSESAAEDAHGELYRPSN